MCGRYDLDTHATDVAESLGALLTFDFAPRLDLRPTDAVAIVRLDEQGRRVVVPARWMLVPRWAKDPSEVHATFNARAETLGTKPTFRDAYRKRRCLVPATAFFEWQYPGGRKRPGAGIKHRIGFEDGRVFCFAGLWDEWQDPAGGPAQVSCTVITCAPNAVIAPIHSRMPVILPSEELARWLDPGAPPDALQQLLVPYAQEGLVAIPVS